MTPGLRGRARALMQRLLRETRGSIALKFALVAPALALVSAGAIDLLAVSAAQSRLQAIADAGALAGAPALALASDDATARERSASFVAGQLSQWSDAPTVVETYEVVSQRGQRGIRVLLEANRQSFFVNLLPPGGWNFVGDALATSVGQTPLCVLATGTSGQMIHLVNNSHLRAPDCGVHSNAGIRIQGAAGSMEGRRIQAVLSATGGKMTPLPGEGAASIVDPFGAMSFPTTNTCPFSDSNPRVFEDGGTHYLEPGEHCQRINVLNKTTLVLKPGDHVFRHDIRLQGHGRLEGEDVFLFFDRDSDPLFGGMNATVNLAGRKEGPYAGMVMATIGGSKPDINLPGRVVEQLLGVVYVRNGFVEVSGSGVAAEDSAWTVIVARDIRLRTAAGIRINADYESSDVPVPNGVGPNGGGLSGGGSRLVD